MNHIKAAFFALSITGLCACSSEPEQNKNIAELKSQYSSMETEYADLRGRMQALDLQIKQLEGTENLSPVTITDVRIGAFDHFIDLKGSVESDENIQVYPEATARIISVNVSEGQNVRKGDIIAVLDSKILEENLRELRGSLELATTMFDRQKRLWDQKIGSEAQYLESKNNKESLQSKVSALEEQIRLHRVRAPFSGTVDQVFAKKGELAGAGSPIIRLVNLDNMYVQAEVSEDNIKDIRVGSQVVINDSLKAKVNSVAQYINPANRTFRVKINLPVGSSFNPNELVKVAILDQSISDAVMIPTSLIQQMNTGENYVYIIDKTEGSRGLVKRVTLDVKSVYNNTAAVVGQINAQTKIIDKGSRNVRDGQFVLVK